ncbi:hypothetical protein [uncultured Lacinutrix sp.]|uniref:hypothetical protein n=1 Tax=uncultured Lacinutrix sp. TaxID=574032 RepID=UPI0026353C4E|nr:hypothetical protein [uncultured Lacinutrix sp.]
MKKTLLLIVVGIIFSCTSKTTLSESEALAILKQDYKGDCYSFVFNKMNDWKSNKNYVDAFYELESKKLVTISKRETFIHGKSTGYILSWQPTEEGLKYKSKKSKQYKLTELIVKDIVGISINQEEKTAVVRFSYDVVYTPFKKVQNRSYGNCKSSTGEYELEFILYDTGWKIKK